MKTLKNFILTTFFILFGTAVFSQGAPPPPPSGHGSDANQPAGNGAPIGSGVGILLAMGAAYAGKKVWDYRKKLEE